MSHQSDKMRASVTRFTPETKPAPPVEEPKTEETTEAPKEE
jgi:hypothetical protein